MNDQQKNTLTSWKLAPLTDEQRYCECCGLVYLPRVRWQKFCSQACSNAWHYDRNRQQRLEYARAKRALNAMNAMNSPVKCNKTHSRQRITKQALIDHQTTVIEQQQKQIDQLLAALQKLATAPSTMLEPATARTGDSSSYSSPEPELVVTKAVADKNNNSGYNYLLSMAALCGDYVGLPAEVLEYGVKTGRLKPEVLQNTSTTDKKPSKQRKQKQVEQTHSGNAKPLAGAGKPLPLPDFDD